MPFDILPRDDDGDPDAALRRWLMARHDIAMSVVEDGETGARSASLVVKLIDHAIWEFWLMWDRPPELGIAGVRLDMLRQALERP